MDLAPQSAGDELVSRSCGRRPIRTRGVNAGVGRFVQAEPDGVRHTVRHRVGELETTSGVEERHPRIDGLEDAEDQCLGILRIGERESLGLLRARLPVDVMTQATGSRGGDHRESDIGQGKGRGIGPFGAVARRSSHPDEAERGDERRTEDGEHDSPPAGDEGDPQNRQESPAS
ncbi:hypothetical protein [Microbacterium trichothecenolyticum]|uniref:Uncharacterized protein n=1 Tax=Microbacterium trichothecenolyticum TaxID=69370 RepID=A0ABU0TVE4_MICTR|nr:hypothetical protein [Microbacterium trichothecenolyticum]MDQ1123641.1 hypothetical protein [Microbacterium trichothecenolyticum]